MGKRIVGLTLLWLLVGFGYARGAEDDYVYDGLGTVTINDAAKEWPKEKAVSITNSYLDVLSGTATLTTLDITATGMDSGLFSEPSTGDSLTFTTANLAGSATYSANLIAGSDMIFDGSVTLDLNSHLLIYPMVNFTAETLEVAGERASATTYGNLEVESFNLSGSGASLSVEGYGFLYAGDSDTVSTVTDGRLYIAGNGAMLYGGLDIDGDSAVVTIVNPSTMGDQYITVGVGKAIALANGTLNISGNVHVTDWGALPVDGGTGSVAVQGGFFNVSGGTAMVDNLSISGGVTTIDSNAKVQALNSFLFGSGIINLNGTLEVLQANQPVFSGQINMNNASLLLANGVKFASNGIVLRGQNNVMSVGGSTETLDIGANAYLDAREGSLTLDGSLHLGYFAVGRGADEFNFAAGYDWDSKTVNGVTLTGQLAIDSDARIIVSNDLLNYIASNPQTPAQIIKAAGGVVDPSSYHETISTNIYHYDIYLNNDGLYGGDFAYYSDDVIAKNLIKAWSPYTQPKNQADGLIKPDFIHAIIDASKVRLNPAYYTLTRDGQYNADALLNLSDPATSGLRYDALMYYNGANAASVSNATIALSGHVQQYLEERMNAMRRMKVLVGEYGTPCGDSCGGDDCSVPECPGDGALTVGPPKNRVWAGVFNIRDNIDSYNGYAGYSLHGKGFMVGAEHDFGSLFSVGGSFAYTGSDFDDYSALADTSRMDLYQFTAYGTYTDPTGLFISGTLGYAWSDNQLNSMRYLYPNVDGNKGWTSADYRSGILSASLQVGYDMFVGDYWTLSPSLGVTHRTSWGNSHHEYFTSAEASWGTLDVGTMRNSLTSVPLKINAAYDVYEDEKSLLTLTGMLGYSYDLQALEAKGDINYIGLQDKVRPVGALAAPERSRHAYHVGVGAKYNYNSWEFGLGYDAVFRKGWKNYTITGNVGVTF